MTEAVPCLLRIGDNVKKYRLFKLERDQVTIGRSVDVTYTILSNMVSRCHAVIDRKADGSWDITDKKSLNGVYVNEKRLTPFVSHKMQEGDIIQFGVPVSPDTPAEFVYRFYSSLKVRIEKKNTNKRLKTDCCQEKDTMSASETFESDSEREVKRKKPAEKSKEDAVDSPSKILRQHLEKSQKEQADKEAEYQARLAEMEKLLKEKEEKQMEVQQQLEKERQEKENQAKEVEELKQKEQAILQEMQDKQEELKKEKEELKEKMQKELEESLKVREQALRDQLSTQHEALMNEKQQVEENLQKEMEKAIEEKNKELEEQLLEQKQKLEKVIEKKELEQKMLESQLNETKEESATAKLQALKARDDVLSNFVDLMEMELQCTICNELFIKATSLNCSHVFCKLCINQWMKVKKECPNCRSPITSQMQALALDNYIDRMVEQLNDDLKQRRKEILALRKTEQEKFDGIAAGPSSVRGAASSSRGGATFRGGGRGGRGASVAASAPSVTSTSSTSSRNTRVSIISTRAAARRGGATANGGVAASVSAASAAPIALTSSTASVISATGTPSATISALLNAAPIATPSAAVPSTAGPTLITAAAAATASASTSSSAPAPVDIDLTAVPAAIVQIPASTGVIAVSSDNEEAEENEEDEEEEEENEEDELTDSDDSFRYRGRYRRRYSSFEDEDEENEDEDGSDSDAVDGDPDAYYGGYGRCYKCGMRGHWANGCPN